MRRRALSWLLIGLLLGSPVAVGGEDSVVLITSARSDFAPLDLVEVRKLFLGFPVIRAGQPLHPLRNQSDARLDQVFLQNIVAMSDTTYDRRVLSLLLQQGRAPPPSVHTQQQLLQAMAQDPYAISFAWAADVAKWPQTRVIRVLWHE